MVSFLGAGDLNSVSQYWLSCSLCKDSLVYAGIVILLKVQRIWIPKNLKLKATRSIIMGTITLLSQIQKLYINNYWHHYLYPFEVQWKGSDLGRRVIRKNIYFLFCKKLKLKGKKTDSQKGVKCLKAVEEASGS